MTPHAEIWFPHDPPWRNSVKHQVFTIILEKIIKLIANCDNFIIFLKKKCQNNVGCSICAYIDSNRNTISEWAVIFRYGNFFIPRVEKSSKISPWGKKSCLPRAYGPWEDKIFRPWANLWGFFHPWDEEISIPENRPIRKSYIYVLSTLNILL